ncbi:MAG TPA: hypothetical protein VIT65_22255 [Microlunatus sp.]
MGRMVKRLSGLEIDEISLVDRPANQHGLVAIAKNDSQEEDMPRLFDAEGNEVDEGELQVGDFVYDEDENEYQVRDDVEPDGGEQTQEYDYDQGELELEGVGKAGIGFGQATRRLVSGQGSGAMSAYARRSKVGEHVARNKSRYALGGAATAGAGGGYALGGVGKSAGRSAGQQFLEDISKAVTDEERDALVAKAFDHAEEVSKRNEILESAVVQLIDDRDLEQYTEIAKSYELGVDDEQLGALLFRASQALPEEDLVLLDRLLAGAGEISKQLFVERGMSTVGGDSDVLEQVYGLAGNAVAKNDFGMTPEQAVTAIFDNNPEAYEAYEAEQALGR